MATAVVPEGFVLEGTQPEAAAPLMNAPPSTGGMAAPKIPEGFVLEQPESPAVSQAGAVDGERPPPKSMFDSGNETAMSLFNEQLAAQQGTSPVIRKMDGTLRYMPADPHAQEMWDSHNFIDPEANVALYDSEAGKVVVFKRSKDTDEGRLMSLMRFLGFGMMAGPATKLPGGVTAASKASPAATRLDDFAGAGIDPSLAAVTGSRSLKQAQNVLHETPIAGGVVEKGVTKTLGQMEGAVEDVAAAYGRGASRVDAGQAARQGAESFVSSGRKISEADAVRLPTRATGFTEKADALYEGVGRHVPAEVETALDNTLDALAGVKDRFPTAPELGKALIPAKFQQYADIVEQAGGKLTFGEAKELRTFVGRQLSNPSIVDDVTRADWKKLYGALSQDMRVLAERQGPEALRAFERADKYYSAGLQRIETALAKILNPKTSDEKIYSDLFNAASGKLQTASVKRLSEIRRSMPDEEWATVASSMIRRMGKVADDAPFSVSTFATNYRNLSPQGKTVLFAGVYTPQRAGLDRLFRVAEHLQDVENLSNKSGTGRIGVGAALGVLGFSGFDGFITAGATVLSSTAAAKLLFSPRFVDLVVKGPQTVRAGPQTAAYLARYQALAASDPELAPAINEFIRALRPALSEDSQPQPTGQ